MAVYKPITAFQNAKAFIKKMPLEEVQLQIVNNVLRMIWMAAPWRWTIGALPDITIASSTQDYSIALPSDYLYPLTSSIISSDDRSPRYLHIEPQLNPGGLVGSPSRVAFLGAAGTTGTARLLPKPGTVPSPAPLILTQYKKKAPLLTKPDLYVAGALVMDDEWVYVFESGVLWLAYQYADDARGGTTNYDSRGQYAYTGQRAIFETNLVQMKEREKFLIVDVRSPEPELNK
jgi:hypothetical protein